MDPITITTSIISSILTIKLWLDNKDKKDNAIKNLSTSVNLVYLILSPLEDPDKARVLHPSVVASLLSVGEVLSRIKDHLSIWKDKHRASVTKLLGFISPSSVVMDLHDDALLLSQHVQTISFALHVSTFLAGHDNLAEKPEPVPDKPMLLGLIKNVDVRLFWEDVIGEKVSPGNSLGMLMLILNIIFTDALCSTCRFPPSPHQMARQCRLRLQRPIL